MPTHYSPKATAFVSDYHPDSRALGLPTAAMTQLHCETIDQDVVRILAKYPNDQELVRALKAATEL